MHLIAKGGNDVLVLFTKFSNPDLCKPIGKKVSILTYENDKVKLLNEIILKLKKKIKFVNEDWHKTSFNLIRIMPKISFPDGKTKEFQKGVNGFIVAESISKSLLKKAVAMQINGVQRDLCDLIN